MKLSQCIPIGFVALLLLLCCTNAFAVGPVETVLHIFTGAPDGMVPMGALIADKAGNLYGTTVFGGVGIGGTYPICCGVVFQLSPPAIEGEAWTETILYRFTGGSDGADPSGTLTFDSQGNLFGLRDGGIFELSPPTTGGGTWTETNLPSPANLQGEKLLYYGGNLYGVTQNGGMAGQGTVFVLKPPTVSGGAWTMRILHSFGVSAGDGTKPMGGLVEHDGSLYGTTNQGGAYADGIGTVFQLTPKSGVWTETVICDFISSSTLGGNPYGLLLFDPAGNIYGTTSRGGGANPNVGSVYELSPPTASGDQWKETTVFSFTSSFSKDGGNPMAGVIRDGANNLYGTASSGGLATGLGVVFKLRPPQTDGGAWTETVLHSFGGVAHHDGVGPDAELLLLKGALFGTTPYGGQVVRPETGGVVFSVVP